MCACAPAFKVCIRQNFLYRESYCPDFFLSKSQVDCENNDPSFESFNLNCQEEEDVPGNANHKYRGVSACVLERKLHELVETRQQEKIAELESELECTKQKLREKEMELQWWKEAQCFASLNQDKAFI